jgi:hypothetical protein
LNPIHILKKIKRAQSFTVNQHINHCELES